MPQAGSVFTILVYPTAGEPFAVATTDFESEDECIRAVTAALTDRVPMRFTDRNERDGDTTLIINPRNVVAVRLVSAAAGPTGQYL